MLNAPAFFETARERYSIKLRRDRGDAKPWSDDKAFQDYRFCNVFREDDTVTQWIRQRIGIPQWGKSTVGGIIVARWFNRIETLEKLLCPAGEETYWRENLLYSWSDIGVWANDGWSNRMRKRLANVKPLVTGAYIIKTPNGMNKLEGLIWSMEQVLPKAVELQEEFAQEGYTLQRATERLAEFPFLGPFMAYEVATDLNYSVLKNAPDKYTWANPGPGCTRGIGRVAMGNPDVFNRGNKGDVKTMLALMAELLDMANWSEHWHPEWPEWDMRTVEHWLCEFDKHQRIHLGEGRPKQTYNGVK